MNKFYVYEHWRPDTNVCFYVGKGKDRRAFLLSRKRDGGYHHLVVAELKRAGLDVEVRIVKDNLSELDAFDYEMKRIVYWRQRGVELINMTEGGDGCSGRILSEQQLEALRNREFTAEWRRKISEAKKGVPKSEEHKRKLSLANLGKKQSTEIIEKRTAKLRGRRRPAYIGAKISAALKGKPNLKGRGRIPWCKGQNLSDETRAKMSAVRLGRKLGPMPEAQKAKIRKTLTGRPNLALAGKPLSAEHRQKIRDAWTRWRLRKTQEGEQETVQGAPT
jgi:hypothetical protein